MAGRIRTLRDLDLLEGGTAASTGKIPPMTCHHIPDLSDADACKRMLQRIHREFYPIMERRGYRVLTLSEMCCCGDGLDHEDGDAENDTPNQATAAAGRQKKRKRRRRKLRTMGLNVLGYNRSHSNGVHDIHLRLRDAGNHSRLLSYEEVAGTMAHELAHCVHGPHNAAFYKLMDEIQEQHAVFLARGIVADDKGFPMNSGEAYTLGGRGASSSTADGGPDAKRAAALAAQARQERSKWMPQGPQRLGGDSQFTSWLAPGQAAGMAAEMRRLHDDQWCQPCSPDDVIELSSDEEEDNDDDVAVAGDTGADDGDKKPAAIDHDDAKGNRDSNDHGAIDLTNDSDDDEGTSSTAAAASSSIARATKKSAIRHDKGAAEDERIEWPCRQCTFVNGPLALACGACGMEARSLHQTLQVVSAIVQADKVQNIKEAEVERAEREFGFNIYGSSGTGSGDRISTRTMNHLT